MNSMSCWKWRRCSTGGVVHIDVHIDVYIDVHIDV